MFKLKIPLLEGKEWKTIIAGAGIIVVLFVWFQLFIIPQRSSLMDSCSRNKTIVKDMALLKEKIARFPQMERQLSQLAGQYDPRMVMTPPEKQLPEILEVVAQAAKAADVRLLGAKPRAEISDLSPGASGFLELPVQVDAFGGYHQLGLFLDALESSRMLVRVHELKIEAHREDIWHHQATFVLWTYLFPVGDQSKS